MQHQPEACASDLGDGQSRYFSNEKNESPNMKTSVTLIIFFKQIK